MRIRADRRRLILWYVYGIGVGWTIPRVLAGRADWPEMACMGVIGGTLMADISLRPGITLG